MNFLVAVCRCNINIAFVLQMWRAESQKAGVGSRSKAAKAPSHPRLSATMLWTRGEWALLKWEEEGWRGWGLVLSPWEPKTWCNRCRPSCRALASPCFSKLLPQSPPPPHCPVRRPAVPVVPKVCSEPDETPVCMAYGLILPPVVECFACLSPTTPAPRLSLHDAPRVVRKGDCWVVKNGAVSRLHTVAVILHGFGVALKSFPLLLPLTMHVDPGWLLPSVSCHSWLS